MSAVRAFTSRFSLRARLTVLSAFGAALVLPLAVLLLRGAVGDALDDAVTAELRVRAEDVVGELEAGVEPVVSEGLLTQVLASDGTVLAPEGAPALVGSTDLPDRGGELIVDRSVAGVGEHARVLVRALEDEGGAAGYVVVAGSTAPIFEVQRRLAVVLGVVGPLLVLAIAATAWVLTRTALQPVRRMTRRAATLSLEEPQSRLPQPPGRDEIAELGQTLNAMLGRIEETMAHERAFVDDASHELRTPIAVLRGELELARLELAEGGAASDGIRAMDSALEEADRLARITEHLLVLARADAGRLADGHERVALMSATARVIDRVGAGAGDVQLQVTGAEAHVMADPDMVEQLLTNLLTNAARFARSVVRVAIERAGDTVVLQVADDGPGFDPDLLDRALDRFSRAGSSRTRSAGGAGLGLAIVSAIVDALGGGIAVSNGPPLGGACVEITLPRAGRER